MVRYTGRRLLLTIPILAGVSIVVFLMIKLVPGDPIATMLGPRATPETRALLSHRYGLDKALPMQYMSWLGNAVRGDLGDSIAQQRDVLTLVRASFSNTLILAGFAALVSIVGGALLGFVSAFGKGRLARSVSSMVSLGAVSMPQYTLGIILVVVFAANLAVLPAGGMRDVTDPTSFTSLLQHLVLPGITAAAIPMGIVARMFAAALKDESQAAYVESLRARGLPERRVRRHIMHGSLASLLTISGLQVGYLLGGVVFVEVIFAWPGVGLLVYQSISKRDFPVIQAGILIAAMAFVVINLVVDIARAALDPRVRASGVVS
jgi:peptide/nickel transport system permease protein